MDQGLREDKDQILVLERRVMVLRAVEIKSGLELAPVKVKVKIWPVVALIQ